MLETPGEFEQQHGQPTGFTTRMTRRSLLQFVVASVGVAAAGSLLAACGGGDDDDPGTGAGTDATATTSGASAATDEPEEPDDDDTSTPSESDDDDDGTPETGGDKTYGEEGTADDDSDDDSDDDDDEAKGDGGKHTVEATTDLVFDPAELTIKVGDTVTWVVAGSFPHTSTCDPAKASNPANAVLPEGAEPWDSGILQDGQEFSHTFDVAGEYMYFCKPHEAMGMLGKLTVEA